jgi:RimJ/RimL family protein N-acetyltransferase
VSLFPPNPNAAAACLEFDRPVCGSDLSPYLDGLPDGYEIHRMDRTFLERISRLDEKINRYTSVENFLDKGLGFCIVRGDEIVCEAYADMEVMGTRELGVFTQRACWGKGLATIACAHLIKACEETGSRTYWDCVKLNLASVAVARKLGFRNQRGYKLLAWFPPSD